MREGKEKRKEGREEGGKREVGGKMKKGEIKKGVTSHLTLGYVTYTVVY